MILDGDFHVKEQMPKGQRKNAGEEGENPFTPAFLGV
jgi:hypothetical protein